MDIATALTHLPRHEFRAVLADPPWTFQSWSAKGEARSAQRHYSCMSRGALDYLDLRRVCDLDCWLFLWATTPMLPSALELMRTWGFTYSGSAFCWAKTTKLCRGDWCSPSAWHVGLGHTTRKNVELCLLGRRGKPSRNSAAVRELIVAPVREHSRKPEAIYDRIEAFCDGPYLELFARHRRLGWQSIGDQLPRP